MPRLDKQKDREYQKIWVEKNRNKTREYAKKYRERNPEKHKLALKKWREEHPDYRKKYYEKNKEKELRQTAQYQKNTPDKQRIYQKRYREKHRETLRKKARDNYVIIDRKTRYERNKPYYLLLEKIRRNRIHSILIWHYSRGTYKCACCGFGDGRVFLELDHLYGNGNKHRNAVGNGNYHLSILKSYLPKAYQVLCSNCNRAKFRNGGICPHKEEDPNHLLSKTNI